MNSNETGEILLVVVVNWFITQMVAIFLMFISNITVLFLTHELYLTLHYPLSLTLLSLSLPSTYVFSYT